MGARGFEQGVGAVDVGGDEIARAMDRAIDMGLGGEMDDAGRREFGEQGIQGGGHKCRCGGRDGADGLSGLPAIPDYPA
jgi:hypothetical protein